MKKRTLLLRSAMLVTAAFVPFVARANIPDSVPYQGRVSVGGVNFTGTGQFKFAIYEHARGDYSAAKAVAAVDGGALTSITVLDGGSGLSSGVTVAFDGGGGTGAAAAATVVDGVMTTITITATGSGYSSAPKVVITDSAAPAQLWNNAVGATHSALTTPATAVSLPVTNGLYVIGLGDRSLANMAALPASLAPAPRKRAFVRVWFNDGLHGFQALAPDTELRSVPFAREAANTAAIGGISLANLARLDAANTFSNIDGITVQGTGPNDVNPAAGATIPLTGAGTRMEFIPGYGAFRAGTVTGTEWDVANVGVHSAALGFNNIASSTYSTALGGFNIASGSCSTAMGFNSAAGGYVATALGNFTTANGSYSTAMGTFTSASGACSIAMGDSTTAKSYAETVIGRYNTNYTPVQPGDWTPADRLFVVGNGTDGTARSDALVMLKSGNMTLNGALRVNHVDGGVITGAGPISSTIPATGASIPVTGAGTRMEFIPGYGAFRAGTVSGDQWDAAKVGLHSTALGVNTTASGANSTALGFCATASGVNSVALGNSAIANGADSMAMGYGATASGKNSIALGDATNASGESAIATGHGNSAWGRYSTSMGLGTSANGECSTALGFYTGANGRYSIATGRGTLARGEAATAMGYFTAGYGDYSTALGYNSAAQGTYSSAIGYYSVANSYAETAIGAYNTNYVPASTTGWNDADRLFVIGNGTGSGTGIGPGSRSDAFVLLKSGKAILSGDLTAKSFISTSDRTLKTDIVPADTAAVLAKVAALPVATWKFKNETVTHLGPMAQDFFAAFQLGGTDTGIASVDADGVALAAIQELATQNTVLKSELAELKARLAAIEAKLK